MPRWAARQPAESPRKRFAVAKPCRCAQYRRSFYDEGSNDDTFSRSCLAAVVPFCAQAVLAFLPPSDKQRRDAPYRRPCRTITPERFQAEKVPADHPLAFTVTLVNERAEPVSGTVKVWLNEDWQIVGDDAFTLHAEPGRSASVACTAGAKPTVLIALYPIHARLALTLDGRETVLHPIAIFDAVLPAHTPGLANIAKCAQRGVLRPMPRWITGSFISQREGARTSA